MLNNLPENLTKNEKDVAEKLLQCMPIREMASSRFTTIRAIRHHIKNIYLKCEVEKRSEFMVKYLGIAEDNRVKKLRDRLSEAEQRVYDIVITGVRNKDAAFELFVTEKTVKFHLTNIYEICNVKNRLELIKQHFKKAADIEQDRLVAEADRRKELAGSCDVLPRGSDEPAL